MDGNNMITAKRLSELLAAERMPKEGPFLAVKSLFETENAEALYNEATKENATAEAKAKWGAYTLKLHQALDAYLTQIENSPEKPAKEVLADIREAYAVNSHLCADALAAEPEGTVQLMVNAAYEDLAKFDRYTEENAAEYEAGLAKLLYLGKLKYELENVHGSEEEMKAWKAEILTELMSGTFAENAAKYKDSEIVKETVAKLRKNPGMDPETAIQSAIVGIAEENYHNVYYGFANVLVENDEDRNLKYKGHEEAEKVADRADELSALADTVGVLRSGKANKVETQFNRYLDPVYIKRRAQIHGMQSNLVGQFRAQDERDARRKQVTDELVEDAKKKFKEDYLKEHKEEARRIHNAKVAKDYLRQIHLIEERINKFDKQIKTLSGMEGLKKAITIEADNPILMIQKSMMELLLEKSKLMAPISSNFTAKEIRELDQNFAKFQNEEKRFNEKLDNELKKVEQDVRNRQNALHKELERMESYQNEARKILAEAKEYKEAVAKNDSETINRIKERRELRDNVDQRTNIQIYESKFYKDLDGKEQLGFKSKSTTDAVLGLKNDREKYMAEHNWKDDNSLVTAIKDEEKQFEEKDKLYQAKPVIEKPERKGLSINAHETFAPIDFETSKINVEENVTRKYVETEINLEQKNESALVTSAVELVDKKGKIIFGSQEYDDIMKGIHKLQDQMNNGRDEVTEIIPMAKKLYIQMEHYIDRKHDEAMKKGGHESARAKERRENMEQAQDALKDAIESLLAKKRVQHEKYIYNDIGYELENVVKLTKETNQEVEKIRQAVGKEDLKTSLTLMQNYLDKRVDKYYKNGKYGFKTGSVGEGGKPNIPADPDERMYKSVLKCYKDLLAYELSTLRFTNPAALEAEKFKLKYPKNNIGKDISIPVKFGMNIAPNGYLTNTEIIKTNNLETYRKQFENQYNGLTAQMHYMGLEEKIKNPKDYNVLCLLSQQDRTYMTEAALSHLFLKNFEGKEFNFKDVEEQRVKFISATKSTQLFNRMNANLAIVHDLKNVNADEEFIRQMSEFKHDMVKGTEKFKENVMIKAVVDEMTDIYFRINRNLARKNNDKDYKPEQLKKDLAVLEYTCEFAKAMGIQNDLVLANGKCDLKNAKQKSGEIKTEDIKDTVKKLKDSVAEKLKAKQTEPAKSVKMK